MKNIYTTLFIGSLSVVLAIPAHAEDTNTECNTPAAAVIGAIMGGLLGGGKNRLGGAVIGAGIASLACTAFNYQTAQTKTSQQVQDDYKTQNGGQLPEQLVVTHYETKIAPSAQVRPGAKTTLNSYIEVVNSANGAIPTIEEEVALFDPDGKQVTKTRKVVNQNGDAGAFNSSFSFTLPEGVKQGVYPVKTAVFLNGQQASTGQVALQVVMTQTGPVVAFWSQ
jgi:hypothetical protein